MEDEFPDFQKGLIFSQVFLPLYWFSEGVIGGLFSKHLKKEPSKFKMFPIFGGVKMSKLGCFQANLVALPHPKHTVQV